MPRGTRDTSQILADTDVARTEILQAEARLSRLYCVHCGTEDSLDQVPLVQTADGSGEKRNDGPIVLCNSSHLAALVLSKGSSMRR